MKAIRTKEVNENVKAANSCLRKAKWQAKELAVFTGEVVRLMDNGKSSVSCPLKPSDSAPLKHSTMPP